MTSSTITGRCPSVGRRPSTYGSVADPGDACGALDPEALEVFRERIGRVHRRAVVGPTGRAPTSRCGHAIRPPRHRLPGRPTPRRPVGTTTRPWRSRLDLEGPGEDEAREGPGTSVRDRFGGDRAARSSKPLRGNSRQAAVDPARDIGPAVEPCTEPRRDRHATLGVDRVPVLAGEHPSLAPRCPDQPASSRSAGPAGPREPSEVASPPLASRSPHSMGCGGPQKRLVHLYSPLRATLGHVGGIIHRAEPPSTRFCASGMGKRSGARPAEVRAADTQLVLPAPQPVRALRRSRTTPIATDLRP